MPVFIEQLKHILSLPLPGEVAHKRMWSDLRAPELLSMPQNERTRLGSVLILIYPYQKAFYSLLILRPDGNDIHSGQIALPGGKAEKDDSSLEFTALREASEEVGISITDVNMLGKLTELYIPPSNYLIHPFVGYCSYRPLFKAQPDEVKEIIEYPINDLLDKDKIKRKEFVIRDDFRFTAPYFDINSHVVWGATGMILREFSELLSGINEKDQLSGK